jgi:hypothetical protein
MSEPWKRYGWVVIWDGNLFGDDEGKPWANEDTAARHAEGIAGAEPRPIFDHRRLKDAAKTHVASAASA